MQAWLQSSLHTIHCGTGVTSLYSFDGQAFSSYQFYFEVVSGALDLAWFEQPERTRADVFKALLKIKVTPVINSSPPTTLTPPIFNKGIGEFAANNICQLLGFFDSFPYDTETRRLWYEQHGSTGALPRHQHLWNY